MTPAEIQLALEHIYDGDHTRLNRMRHFMGLLRSAVDGMATLGVVLKLEVEGLKTTETDMVSPPSPLESLELAIAHMQQATKEL